MPSLNDLYNAGAPKNEEGMLERIFKYAIPGYGMDPNSPEAKNMLAQVRQGATEAAMNLGPGAIAFHGSPHLFEKFALSKIGTGEGAQAYGHGLYFAENPAVAKSYAGPDFRTVLTGGLGEVGNARAEKALVEAAGDKTSALTSLSRQLEILKRGGGTGNEAHIHATESAINQINKGNISVRQEKNLYKVDIPDTAINKMLDWDKPLRQQPESVRKALQSLIGTKNITNETSGEMILRRLADTPSGWSNESMAATSESLRKAGIPGIKYLDQGSRQAGKGTYNYVVFDENLPKILGRE